MPQPIRLYVTKFCGYCRAAVRLLDDAGIPYEKFDLTNDPATRDRIVEETGWRTVPIVFIGDEMIGGFTELAALDKQGGLLARVTGSASPS